jgi:hypothetical protein
MAISVTGDAELKTDYNKPPTDLDAMGIYSDVLVFGTTDHRTAIVEYLAEVLLVRPLRGEIPMIADPGADQAPGHTVSRYGHWAAGRFHPCRMGTRLASGVVV